MKMWRIVTLAIVFVSIAVPVLAAFTTWLPPAIRTAVFAVAPPVAVAFLLVVYFNWRAKLKSRVVAGEEREEELLTPA